MSFVPLRPPGLAAAWGRGLLVAIAALVATVALLAVAGAPAARADAGDPLLYYGGPIVHSTNGVVVAWGPNVNPIFTNSSTGDPGLIKSFAAASGSTANVGGVLAQYASTAYVDNGSLGSGATIPAGNAAPSVTYGGEYTITPSIMSSTIYDSQIQTELASQIENGNLPRPQGPSGLGTVYLLLFPAGDAECMEQYVCGGNYAQGISFCAYHGDARLSDGTIALYEVLPDDTSSQLNQACGPSSSALADQTSYASHEWSESITDPLVGEARSIGSPLAWYDNNCPTQTSLCREIGDKCDQIQGVVSGFTVQLEWSNLDAACEDTEPSYPGPNASFTGGSSGVTGAPIPFDGSGSSDPPQDHTSATFDTKSYSISPGIASYSWNWGDGSPTATGASASHSFSSPGQYQVSLTVTDNLGFTSTVTHAVNVSSSSPAPPVATTGPATGIDDADATVSGTVDTGGQPVSYSFRYGTSAAALNQSTSSVQLPPGSSPDPVSATLSGLTPATTFYYQLMVSAGGQPYPGAMESFTTTATQASDQGQNPPTTTTPAPATTPTPSPTPGSAPGAAQLPSATTGGVSGLASSKATVSGSVNPNGSGTTYLVEFGTSTSYGHSSRSTSAGAGTTPVSVSALLTGLRPRTVYHYRVVATNAAGTVVGADRTFKTPAAPPPPPRFSFKAPARMTVAALLAGKLRVAFHCSVSCTAHFAVTVALSGIQRFAAMPATLARGTGRLRRAGSGRVKLIFTRASRATLRRGGSIKLVISGYAVRGTSNPSPPRTARLIVTR